MDNTYYTTEHRKGQHLFSEERHEIEVRLKDGWSIYKIAKHLQRPYNTIKNEVNRGTVQTDDGQNKRYSADKGEQVYKDNRKNSRRQYNCLKAVKFLTYVVEKFQGDEKWSLDAAHGAALKSGEFKRSIPGYLSAGRSGVAVIRGCQFRDQICFQESRRLAEGTYVRSD